MRVLSLLLVSFILGSCAHQSVMKSESEVARKPAAQMSCEEFNALPATAKLDFMFKNHLDSAAEVHASVTRDEMLGGENGTRKYVYDFLGGALNRAHQFKDAAHATAAFLAPGEHESLGYKRLAPTITRACDFFPEPQVKMVHALGTMAIAHLKIYDRLTEVDKDGKLGAEVDNPWTGLFNSQASGGSVPMLVRFSIANPVGITTKVGGKSLSLEFIPGLGMKFLVDGKKSVDLLAMESLAGQGDDQNFFKYEFSPDFSAHAPSKFNTGVGADKKMILERYNRNPLNHHVMNLVGERFTQVIPTAYGIDPSKIIPNSNIGPHGFIISIQGLASVDRFGRPVPTEEQKRPWRLVFRPALESLSHNRQYLIKDAQPYRVTFLGEIEQALSGWQQDFRYKLASLVAGDVVYFVEGETKSGRRYRVGEIVLDSVPFPSMYGDREFFIQHELEMNRMPGNDRAIVDP